MKKKVNGFYYTVDKIVYKNHGWYREENNGFLYRDGIYKTRLKPEDLPDDFVHEYLYGRYGYMSTKGVTHVVYHPNYVFNHVYKDDSLYISYSGEIKLEEGERTYRDVSGYDIIMGGPGILEVAKAIQKNSGIDMSEIISVMEAKPFWFKKTYPDGFSRVGDYDFTQHYYEAKNKCA